MIEVIDGLARFCTLRELPRVVRPDGALQREEADEDDVAWSGTAA